MSMFIQQLIQISYIDLDLDLSCKQVEKILIMIWKRTQYWNTNITDTPDCVPW